MEEESGHNVSQMIQDIIEREKPDGTFAWDFGREGWDSHIYDMSHPWISEESFYPSAIVYSIAFLVGVTGNSLVVFATLGDKKSRSVTTSFLVSLALADLLFLLICVPFDMIKAFTGSWSGGLVMCKLTAFMETLTGMASVLNLTAVSIERYIVIVHPMKSRTWCTVGKTSRILFCVWIAAMVLASPRLYVMVTSSNIQYFVLGSDETTANPVRRVQYMNIVLCSDDNLSAAGDKVAFAVYMFLVMFMLPMLLMIFCYARVIWVLWVSTQELARMTSTTAKRNYKTTATDETKQSLTASSCASGQDGHGDRNPLNKAQQDHSAEICQARKQVIKMLVTIIAIFLLAWGPKLIFEIPRRLELVGPDLFHLKLCVFLLPYLQSAVNPIIYGFMSKNFRRSMRSACRAYFCKFCFTRCRRKDHCGDFDLESRTMNGTMSHSVVTTSISPSLSGRAGKKKEFTADTEM